MRVEGEIVRNVYTLNFIQRNAVVKSGDFFLEKIKELIEGKLLKKGCKYHGSE